MQPISVEIMKWSGRRSRGHCFYAGRKGRAIPRIGGHSPKNLVSGSRLQGGLRGLTFVRIRIILIAVQHFVLLLGCFSKWK
ncbi:hypothetical protein BH24ACI3_BH24ACI3_15430 [soil metagenome]